MPFMQAIEQTFRSRCQVNVVDELRQKLENRMRFYNLSRSWPIRNESVGKNYMWLTGEVQELFHMDAKWIEEGDFPNNLQILELYLEACRLRPITDNAQSSLAARF